ncbi:voltage-gated potassium channel [Agromyces marinus]|uniref:Voltage-gated potassium channel n=2 Tax=Agromyces marinus TaxID=1389020 RepID=A0ABM8GYT4_9MICO|nr:voltage-gated potassium channel [Agromyces marinus]
MAVLGFCFVAAYTVSVLAPEFAHDWRVVFNVVFIATWVAFLVDFVVRLSLTPAGSRWDYLWHHPIEFLSVLVPVFRALRAVTLLRNLPVLQRRTREAVRANFVVSAALYAVMYVFFLALATLQAERHAEGATITSFGDALWWAVVTLTTVGYGDTYPVTVLGRTWAVFLMIGGIAIVGVASATVISILNERLNALRNGNAEGAPILAERESIRPDDVADADDAVDPDGAEPDTGPAR